MIVAYLRVSTGKQTLANQQNEILKFTGSRNLHVDRWVTEVVSGKKKGCERKLGVLIRRMKQGDTLIVTELSRLSRTLTDIMTIVGELLRKEVHLYSTKDHYAFDDTINSKVLCFAFGLVAEIERNLISMRTREALALRREQGVVLGRRKGSYTKLQQLIDHRTQIVGMMNRGKSVAAICREYGVARNTFDRFRKQYLYAIGHGDRQRYRINGNALARRLNTTKEAGPMAQALLPLTLLRPPFTLPSEGPAGWPLCPKNAADENGNTGRDVVKGGFTTAPSPNTNGRI